jgi:pimeloyl-ACP methyl ester carboxylesterase
VETLDDILIRPTQTDRLAERIPNAQVLRFDDAGHGVTFQKAAELNAALREHFAQHGSDRPRATPAVAARV